MQYDRTIISQEGNVYRRIRTLGKGGNGVAILCISESAPYQGARLVLKLLLKPSDEGSFRFQQECKLLEQQNHPNLAPLYSLGEINQDGLKPYFASQYYPLTLHNIIKRDATDERTKLKYAVQLMSAVTLLDQEAYAHRDIKPKNIFGSSAELVGR